MTLPGLEGGFGGYPVVPLELAALCMTSLQLCLFFLWFSCDVQNATEGHRVCCT